MTEFKVGDRVKVVNHRDSGYYYCPMGDEYANKTATITKRYTNNGVEKYVMVDWDDKSLTDHGGWFAHRFEKVDDTEIHITIRETVDKAFKDYSIEHVKDSLVNDLIENLNRKHNLV